MYLLLSLEDSRPLRTSVEVSLLSTLPYFPFPQALSQPVTPSFHLPPLALFLLSDCSLAAYLHLLPGRLIFSGSNRCPDPLQSGRVELMVGNCQSSLELIFSKVRSRVTSWGLQHLPVSQKSTSRKWMQNSLRVMYVCAYSTFQIWFIQGERRKE